MIRIASFDVFDTALTRKYAIPQDLFLELGQVLRARKLFFKEPSIFFSSRIDAELRARRKLPHHEVTLRQIYHELQVELSWTDEQMLEAMQVEINIEESCLAGVHSIREKIQHARTQVDRIFFLSDMYLPSETIRSVLKRESLCLPEDRLLVSCECGLSKHSGSMYQALIQEMNGMHFKWEHTGDNPHSDYRVPRKFGIQATLFDNVLLRPREHSLSKIANIDALSKSKLLGALRQSRLQLSAESKDQTRPFVESSVNVAGFLIFAYVWWVLRCAEDQQIKRLYFVSRDGQVLTRVARVLKESWDLDVDIRYLYGSRQAWHAPGITDLNFSRLSWLFAGKTSPSPAKILQRLGLSPSEASSFFDFARSKGLCLETINREFLLDLIQTNPWGASILNNAAFKRAELKSYLQQERFFDGTKSAIVDVGWHGNLQASLSRSLTAMGKDMNTIGFYFGLVQGASAHQMLSMFGFYNDLFGKKFPNEASYIIELFLAADHGTVTGYHQSMGLWHPILKSPRNDLALEWGLEDHQQCVALAASYCAKSFTFHYPQMRDIATLACNHFLQFFHNPTRAEVESWRGFHFTSDQEEASVRSLVPQFDWWQATRATFFNQHRPEGYWIQGAKAIKQSPFIGLYYFAKKILANLK